MTSITPNTVTVADISRNISAHRRDIHRLDTTTIIMKKVWQTKISMKSTMPKRSPWIEKAKIRSDLIYERSICNTAKLLLSCFDHTAFSSPTGPTAESYSHTHSEVHAGPPYLPIPYDTNFHVAPTAHEHAHPYPSSYGTGPEGRQLQPRISHTKKIQTVNTKPTVLVHWKEKMKRENHLDF